MPDQLHRCGDCNHPFGSEAALRMHQNSNRTDCDARDDRGLTPAQQEILAAIREAGTATAPELADATGRAPASVYPHLRKLLEADAIEDVGGGRGAQYRSVEVFVGGDQSLAWHATPDCYLLQQAKNVYRKDRGVVDRGREPCPDCTTGPTMPDMLDPCPECDRVVNWFACDRCPKCGARRQS